MAGKQGKVNAGDPGANQDPTVPSSNSAARLPAGAADTPAILLPRETFDVIVVGGGPAGSTCAAFCARGGLRTLLLERAVFPREKVCGDCLNPGCWGVLERLGAAALLRKLPHGKVNEIEFAGLRGRSVRFPLPRQLAFRRSVLDQVLLNHARRAGVEVREGLAVTSVEEGFRIHCGREMFASRYLVGADGRNSLAARMSGLLAATGRERIAVQCYAAIPPRWGGRLALRLLPDGYCGLAPVGEGQLNVCLVTTPLKLAAMKQWGEQQFGIPPDQQWQSISPIFRPPAACGRHKLLLVGDAARVVEPFTGEGIFYALQSGELAAEAILRHPENPEPFYRTAHRDLYRGRLWINQLAKAAVLSPQWASLALAFLRVLPFPLQVLTRKVATQQPLAR